VRACYFFNGRQQSLRTSQAKHYSPNSGNKNIHQKQYQHISFYSQGDGAGNTI